MESFIICEQGKVGALVAATAFSKNLPYESVNSDNSTT